MNIINAIKADHREMRVLCNQIKRAMPKGKPSRDNPFNLLVDLVRSHDRSEEEVVYDRLMNIIEIHNSVIKGLEEHKIIERLFSELSDATGNESRWMAKMNIIIDLLIPHIDNEENQILPQLKNFFPREELVDMADTFRRLKRRASSSDAILREPPLPHSMPTIDKNIF